MTNLLVLEDRVLREIARDPRFAHISCVQSFNSAVSSAKKQCGRCKKQLNAAYGPALQTFSGCLSRLPPATREEMKRLLNARQLRVIRPNSKGQRVQVTF